MAASLVCPYFRSSNDWISETASNEKDEERLEEAMLELYNELARRGKESDKDFRKNKDEGIK